MFLLKIDYVVTWEDIFAAVLDMFEILVIFQVECIPDVRQDAFDESLEDSPVVSQHVVDGCCQANYCIVGVTYQILRCERGLLWNFEGWDFRMVV